MPSVVGVRGFVVGLVVSDEKSSGEGVSTSLDPLRRKLVSKIGEIGNESFSNREEILDPSSFESLNHRENPLYLFS